MFSTSRKSKVKTLIPRRSSSSASDFRVSMVPLGTASDARHSIRPPMGRRSSSLSHVDRATSGRPSLSQGKRHPATKDTRPLNDRDFQQTCAHRLHSFLACHANASQVTVQQILRMSNKQFASTFLFLVNIMDPTFKLGPRVEESVMNMLQLLQYPFAVSKSMLQAIGSRLPLALGILTWLLDVVEYYESVDVFEHLFSDDAPLKDGSQVSGSHISRLVQYGLAPRDNSPDASAEDDLFLQQLVQEKYGELESAEDLQSEIDRVRKEVQYREAQKAEYLQQLETIASNKKAAEELEGFVESFDQFYTIKQKALEDVKRTNAEMEREIEVLKKDLANARATLDMQKQRREDKRSLEDQLQQAQASLKHVENKMNLALEELDELQMQWSNLLGKAQRDSTEIEALYSELHCNLESFPNPIPAMLKNLHYDETSSLEDLKQQCTVLKDITSTLQQIKVKSLAGARHESELAQRYEAEHQEVVREEQMEREILDQAVASHEKVKQGLLEQINAKKAQHAQLQKDLIIAQSETVATCADDTLLSLQQRVDAACTEYKDLQLQLETMKAKCEKHMKHVEALAEEKMKSLMNCFKRLQELAKPT
ncbi:kinetochore protein NDC80 homolog [Ornithodoros turicata]|uniref:kinetochore protein NDC80 homolog n=1 Tax=Ornithodoros turicata TaxID=34597 RepID=UPI00313946D6